MRSFSGEDGDEEPAGLVEETAERIQRRIIAGEFPVGTWLRQDRIAAELGVSRTPVREALRKLQAVGLVEVIPRRGAVVRHLNARVFSEAFVVRAELEGLAAQLAADLADDEQLARLEEAATTFDACVEELQSRSAKPWEEAMWAANALFHETVVGAADNLCLARALQDLQLRISNNAAWEAALARRTHVLRRNMKEHHEILDAIMQHDGERARNAMRNHVLRTGELVAKVLRS
ncbi:MAG: GntR family transcriptional regulator [Dehalococcoidia bacterium]